MRLICFLAAIAVLFCLSDASAQTAYAATPTYGDAYASPSAQAAGLRLLTWPGKVQPAQSPRPRAAARAATSGNYSGVALRGADPRPATAMAPPPATRRVWDPVSGTVEPSPQPAALPTNIYAPAPPRPVAAAPIAPTLPAASLRPAPPAPRVLAQAQAQPQANDTSDYQPTHFYSVHRQYGQAPDPIPLDAQFFASSSPDLAQPPPPVPRTVTTSSGRVIQATPPSPDDVPG